MVLVWGSFYMLIMMRTRYTTLVPMFVLILQLLSMGLSNALLFDSCPTNKCSCVSSTIRCHQLGLTEVPHFTDVNDPFSLLDLSNNRIFSVGAYAFANVTTYELDLTNNPIQKFSDDAFLGLENSLERLYLENCNLTSLPSSLGALRQLKSLNVKLNPELTSLPATIFQSLGPSLEVIDFSNTKINTWPVDALINLPRLKDIKASGNGFITIPDNALTQYANSLKTLDLSYNKLDHFPDAISQLRGLATLDLSYNNLGTIPPGKLFNCRYSLNTLHLVHVFFREIPPEGLKDLSRLEKLYLSYNPITGAESTAFHGPVRYSLQVLHLDHTFLTSVPAAINSLTNLTEFNFTWNRVAVLDNYNFHSLTNLEVLYLDRNPVTNIKFAAFAGLTHLRSLYLRNLSITFVPNAALSNLTSLQTVDMSDCQINSLFDFGFPDMNFLMQLVLAGNPLKSISDHAFDDLSHLLTLNLERSQLSSIPKAVQQMNSVRTIKMGGSPIQCTCQSLSWVENWRSNRGLIANVEGQCTNLPKSIQDYLDHENRNCP